VPDGTARGHRTRSRQGLADPVLPRRHGPTHRWTDAVTSEEAGAKGGKRRRFLVPQHNSGRLFYHPCFATRLGGVSGGKETQGWRDSSHTAMAGAGKFGSAKLPMATATCPGKPSLSQ
jgi:hypothetical protein